MADGGIDWSKLWALLYPDGESFNSFKDCSWGDPDWTTCFNSSTNYYWEWPVTFILAIAKILVTNLSLGAAQGVPANLAKLPVNTYWIDMGFYQSDNIGTLAFVVVDMIITGYSIYTGIQMFNANVESSMYYYVAIGTWIAAAFQCVHFIIAIIY